MQINWTPNAWEDFSYWITADKKMIKKILILIQDIQRNGYIGLGKPEPLKYEFAGYWSRRIDEKNRIVYKIEEDSILVIQCGGHYKDK